jgi:hypothetical protein
MHSTGQEIDTKRAAWKKASRSQNQNGNHCVEVADLGALVAIRDSKHPDGPIIILDGDEWRAFEEAVTAGDLDLPASRSKELSERVTDASDLPDEMDWQPVGNGLDVAIFGDGVAVRDRKDFHKDPLVFTDTEWAYFVDAMCNGEFDLTARIQEGPYELGVSL